MRRDLPLPSAAFPGGRRGERLVDALPRLLDEGRLSGRSNAELSAELRDWQAWAFRERERGSVLRLMARDGDSYAGAAVREFESEVDGCYARVTRPIVEEIRRRVAVVATTRQRPRSSEMVAAELVVRFPVRMVSFYAR